MLIDWEAVVHDLEDHIQSKTSHGREQLLQLLAEARSRHRQTEGLPEKALRLYPDDLVEALSRRPADREADESLEAMANGSPIRSE